MSTHVVELSSDLVRFLRPLSDRPLREVTEELLVLELYRRHQLSSGKAAELLGMSRWEFIHYASRQGIRSLTLPKMKSMKSPWAAAEIGPVDVTPDSRQSVA